MSLKPAAQSHVAELSDDEGCHLAAGTGSQHLDSSRVSAMYLRRHGDEIHQALDVRVNPTTYSEERGQVEVLRLPHVEDALEWYRKQYTDVQFDVFNCSWDDLFGQMARAQGDHEARSSRKGSSNWFKYLWRKAGSKSDAIEPWLHLIPDEYGLSIVRGAIGIVFHMAEKAHEKEKSILEGFEIITETIHDAMNKGVSFQREPEMHACCQALYDTLVEGIADLIWSLKPEAKGKNFIEKLKNKQEKQKSIDIKGLIKKVQKKSLELDQCAERILARKATETRDGVGLLQVEATVARSMLVDAADGQNHLIAIAQQTSSDVHLVGQSVQYLGEAANNVVRYMFEENQALRKRLQFMNQDHKQVLSATESQNATIAFLTETVLNLNRKHEYLLEGQHHLLEEQTAFVRDVRRSLTPIPAKKPAHLIMTPTELLDDLGVSLNMADQDFKDANLYGRSFTRKAQEQAQSLLATNKFLDWYKSDRAEMLFVDGNDTTATRSLYSPMSLMCANVSQAVEQAGQSGIVIRYFCSMHTSKESDSERNLARGPAGMLRSILVQLLAGLANIDLERKYDMGEIKPEYHNDFRANLRDGCLPELRMVLFALLRNVPPDMPVYCFIDGISFFEDDRFKDELQDVVNDLDDIVGRTRTKFKLLMTCPYRSVFLVPKDLIRPREYLMLEAGGRGGLGLVSQKSVMSHLSR